MRKEEERKARLERELREKEKQVETLVLLVAETGVVQFYNFTCVKVRERQEREKRERRQREERARREEQERRRRAEKANRREE